MSNWKAVELIDDFGSTTVAIKGFGKTIELEGDAYTIGDEIASLLNDLTQRLNAVEVERDESRNIAMNMMMRDQAIQAIVKEGYIPEHILKCFSSLNGDVRFFEAKGGEE